MATWREKYKDFLAKRSPQFNVVFGFLLYAVAGALLLCIPLFHKVDISFLDNIFTSISAISTTGLVTVDIANSYNFFGQLIILSLFQIGGIGYMTLTTYFLLFTTNRITHWHNDVIGAEFTLPKTIKIKDFIKSVIIFTIVMEVLGATAFTIEFLGEGMGVGESIWYGIFHSVSSFCTAGFSLFDGSFEGFRDNSAITTTVAILSIAGSLGFILITDLWYRISGRTKKLSFSTKIIFNGFLALLTLGTLIFYFTNESGKFGDNDFQYAFFQAMSSMTTVGFNSIPLNELQLPLVLLVTFLMYIGASPSGTAGGLKITTLIAMISVLKSRLFGQKKITFMNRRIPYERLYVATSTFMLYTSLIFLFTYFLSITESFPLDQILFEVASALGTVGLSTGITGDLSSIGKVLVILIMFIGRVGVLTFGFALLHKKITNENECPEDDLVV